MQRYLRFKIRAFIFKINVMSMTVLKDKSIALQDLLKQRP